MSGAFPYFRKSFLSVDRTWKKAQTEGFCPSRQNHTCDLFGGKLLVYGGMASSTHGDIALGDLRILDLRMQLYCCSFLQLIGHISQIR
jgi:hypothetical protein